MNIAKRKFKLVAITGKPRIRFSGPDFLAAQASIDDF